MCLTDILAPIREELESFDRELEVQLRTDSTLIYQVTRHLFTSPGKKLRPSLVFLSAKLFGNGGRDAVLPALALELELVIPEKKPGYIVVYDVAGRARMKMDIGGFGPGHHKLQLGRRFASGV